MLEFYRTSEFPLLKTSLAMAGKFCVTGSFGLLYLYTSEMYPTAVRSVTLGSCSMFARIGSILAPFVHELGKLLHPAVPNVLYGLLALTSGLLALLLPETKGRILPDTLEEGEKIGSSMEIWNIPDADAVFVARSSLYTTRL
ncbi:UNVERIFIED_CONTAM: Solute carrier family 22 member 8 [Trichonephila clavipes]